MPQVSSKHQNEYNIHKDKKSRFDEIKKTSQRRHVLKDGITLVSMLWYFLKIKKKNEKGRNVSCYFSCLQKLIVPSLVTFIIILLPAFSL